MPGSARQPATAIAGLDLAGWLVTMDALQTQREAARLITEVEKGRHLVIVERSKHLGRVRSPGGGRKRQADLDAGLRPALLAPVEPDERGDPMSPLRWTTKSLRALAGELTRQGHPAGADTQAKG